MRGYAKIITLSTGWRRASTSPTTCTSSYHNYNYNLPLLVHLADNKNEALLFIPLLFIHKYDACPTKLSLLVCSLRHFPNKLLQPTPAVRVFQAAQLRARRDRLYRDSHRQVVPHVPAATGMAHPCYL